MSRYIASLADSDIYLISINVTRSIIEVFFFSTKAGRSTSVPVHSSYLSWMFLSHHN